ncbi:MAG: toxin-activating lysine-acyltransferase [Gammaproteobacteria bacterium PRO9]|nr:toxin-activating lysine-acyltransferase [Gammaproteobacteria bacterium PRO9]
MTSPASTVRETIGLHEQLLHDHVAVLSLMSSSPFHKAWTPRDVLQWILPPMALGQYVLATSGGVGVAFATWAFVDDEGHQLLKAGRALKPEQWKSGQHIWVVDFIAPFGHCRDLARLLRVVGAAAGLAGKKAHRIRRYAPAAGGDT